MDFGNECLEFYRQTPFNNGSQYVMLLDGGSKPIKYDEKRGMYLMNHNEEYQFLIANDNDRLRAMFLITVDGDSIGRFTVDPNTQYRLKRPVSADRKFVFVARNSQLGRQGGLDKKSVSDLGVCEVEVRLEKLSEGVLHCVNGKSVINRPGYECECMETDEVGGTILGAKTDQQYITVPSYDSEKVSFFRIKMGLLLPEVAPLTTY